jgi:dCTP deaminase
MLADSEIRRRVMLGRQPIPPAPVEPAVLDHEEIVWEYEKERMAHQEILRSRMVIEPFHDYDDPLPEEVVSWGISSAGYDIRVGFNFKIFSNTAGIVVNPKTLRKNAAAFKHVTAQQGEEVVIPPNCFAVAESMERIEMPEDCIVIILGKSTYARTGIVLNCTPLEPAWRGVITLEISNTTPLPAIIFAGEGIGQMLFSPVVGKIERNYDQKPRKLYQDQLGLTLPGG